MLFFQIYVKGHDKGHGIDVQSDYIKYWFNI